MRFNFENLVVWKIAVDLSKKAYQITSSYPKSELYGLTSQTRRAATSIALNIAEGKGRNSEKEFIRFLNIAKGSLLEFVTCMELSKDLNYINNSIHSEMRADSYSLMRKITGLIKAIQSKSSEAQPVST